MKNGNNQKRVDKLLPVFAAVDGPLTQVVVDAWDPSFRPKLERNKKPKLVIHYKHFQYINILDHDIAWFTLRVSHTKIVQTHVGNKVNGLNPGVSVISVV